MGLKPKTNKFLINIHWSSIYNLDKRIGNMGNNSSFDSNELQNYLVLVTKCCRDYAFSF